MKFSPDGKRLACANISEAFEPVGLLIAEMNEDTVKIEYETEKIPYIFDSIEWINNETLRYHYRDYNSDTKKYSNHYKDVIYRGSVWTE